MKKKFASQYLVLFGLAFGVRLIFLILEFWILNYSSEVFLSHSNAGSFLSISKEIFLGHEHGKIDPYVSPGWPIIFGWANWMGIGLEMMLLLSVILAALVPCLFFRLSQNFAASLLLCFFTPAWLLHSINPMSEASYLFFGLLTLLLLKERQIFATGLAAGVTFVINPYAVVVLIGVLFAMSRSHGSSLRQVIFFLLGGAIVPGVSWLMSLPSFSIPVGQWGLPLWDIISFPWKEKATPVWKTDYVYIHVIILLFVVFYALRKIKPFFRKEADPIDQVMLLWFLGNSLLIICFGSPGFHNFDRYFLWGWPPMLWLLKEYVRFRWVTFVPLFMLSIGFAAFLLTRPS